ncbi:MAG: thioredoxin 1 [Clostridiales bacterium]|jgi:thioredoxin 1|nr:thioredoxin 1 [Clostridiales bacterium]MDN5281127.1 thioredoxin 1 [Candidatus Ozemobacter sp.]
MSTGVEKINSVNFSEFTGKGTVLVDFWAPWCGPCQMQLPILESVAQKVGDKAKIAKLNVEENPDIASKFNIFSIPILILFKDGQQVKVFQGLQTEEALVRAVS